MNQRIAILFAAATIAATLLASCTEPGPPARQSVRASPQPRAPSLAVHDIRAAGEGLDSAVQVQPLRDPAIDGFLANAHEAERKRDFATATREANEALKLAPGAPEIVQYLAELAIERGDWADGGRLALQSFESGPKVGSICARNWQTVVESRTALGDNVGAADARAKLKDCRVAPRLRM